MEARAAAEAEWRRLTSGATDVEPGHSRVGEFQDIKLVDFGQPPARSRGKGNLSSRPIQHSVYGPRGRRLQAWRAWEKKQ